MDDKLKMSYSAQPKKAIMESEYERPSFGKTKRYYKEVDCRACQGRGTDGCGFMCDGCNGRGTQTVLEREEV